MTKLLQLISKRNALIKHLERHKKTCYLQNCKHCSYTQNDIDFETISIQLYNPLEEYYKTLNADL